MSFTVVIPARYGAGRFPGKVLKTLQGKAILQHVYERALQSGAEQVIIATDDERIAHAAKGFDANVCMTAETHCCGTERLAQVAQEYNLPDDAIVVNLQADEPFMPQQAIRDVADLLKQNSAKFAATLCVPITDKSEIFNPNSVKVVFDNTGRALYFSRAPIPFEREQFTKDPETVELGEQRYYRHLGIYAYTAASLTTYLTWGQSDLEKIERLEQLRILANGEAMQIAVTDLAIPPGIDTEEDLRHAEKVMAVSA